MALAAMRLDVGASVGWPSSCDSRMERVSVVSDEEGVLMKAVVMMMVLTTDVDDWMDAEA